MVQEIRSQEKQQVPEWWLPLAEWNKRHKFIPKKVIAPKSSGTEEKDSASKKEDAKKRKSILQ